MKGLPTTSASRLIVVVGNDYKAAGADSGQGDEDVPQSPLHRILHPCDWNYVWSEIW